MTYSALVTCEWCATAQSAVWKDSAVRTYRINAAPAYSMTEQADDLDC